MTYLKTMLGFAFRVMTAYFWAFLLSCGVNAQQNGYKGHSEFLMAWGVVLIAIALVGFRRTDDLIVTLCESGPEKEKR